MHGIDAEYSHSHVCLSVNLLVMTVRPAKTAELIEMLFGERLVWAQGTMY